MSRPNSDEQSSFEPDLEHLIMALTAHGYPQELTGRDGALAAFRAASQPSPSFGAQSFGAQSFGAQSFGAGAGRPARHRSARRQARVPWQRVSGFLIPVRLATVAAAGVAALFAGVTAAAYAQALPASVQHLAHSVLAPLGVPNSHPATRSSGPALAVPSTSPATVSAAGQPSSGASQAAACPCPATSTVSTARPTVTYAITLSAAKARVKSDAFDLFSGKVSAHGRPAKGIHVRLLERAAGASGWHVAATGVTGPRGEVKLQVRVATKATFKLAAPNDSRSLPVLVTVNAPVTLRLTVGQPTDRLIVTAPSGSSGETVWLTTLDNGNWDNVTSLRLGAGLHATFAVTASVAEGHFYRAELLAAGAQPQTLSNALRVPKTHRHTGGNAIGGPSPAPSPTPSATGSPAGPSPTGPAGSPTPTPTQPAPTGPASSPAPTSSSPAPPSQSPVPPGSTAAPAPPTGSPAPTTAPSPPPASPAPASPTPTGTSPA